jgi:hypothetical protein
MGGKDGGNGVPIIARRSGVGVKVRVGVGVSVGVGVGSGVKDGSGVTLGARVYVAVARRSGCGEICALLQADRANASIA